MVGPRIFLFECVAVTIVDNAIAAAVAIAISAAAAAALLLSLSLSLGKSLFPSESHE
jgi:uncharacterized membrane protein